MLKIKDNVDLKELEKFGFKKEEYYYTVKFDYKYYKVNVMVELDRRCIIIQNDYYDSDYACYVPDVIYDLIQAGLVEKVEDKWNIVLY